MNKTIRTSLLFGSLPLLAPALAAADPVSVTMTTSVPAGKKPTLTIKANARVTDVDLELTRSEGEGKVTVKVPAMGPGQTRVVTLGDGAVGVSRWEGTLSLKHDGSEEWSSPIDVETKVNQEIRIGYRRDHLDLEKHLLEFQVSRPAKQLEIELTVLGDDGQQIGFGSKQLDAAAPGTWIGIPWEPTSDANVMMMKLKVTDPGGWVEETLTPWSVSIPHEDVNFATNSAVIDAPEQPKLDSAYEKILAEVTKAENLGVKCSLFISGHTDTVGPRDKNQKLSLDRAKAIAGFFRKKGLTIKISYEGFGEDRLKVQTPDETDEPANRRADYVLSAEAPPALGQVFHWKEVR